MAPKVEILSPAGSYESLKAAIAAGADAVYVGGMRFGARAYANNLQEEQLLEAIDYVHLHGRKIYLTINTLLKEHELNNELYDYLLPYYRQGLDAVIVQDIGVLQYIRKQFPDLPIHASTQMTITNLLGVQFLEELGVERVVTSRELSLDEIKEITEHTNVEIESFVHGALCYCYSGQCLYSSMLGGRSGNRGQCAQPCRLPYQVNGDKNSKFVLSLKDICTLEYIPELVEAGIYSFKIEGRMKKPEYVALVTAMYRKYVDLYLEKGRKGFKVDPKDKEKLMDLYNRGGFHGGYYQTKNGPDMVSKDRPNHAGVPALRLVNQSGKSITAKALINLGKGDVIEISNEDNYTLANDIRQGQNISFVSHKKMVFDKGAIFNRTRNEKLIAEIQNTIIDKKVKENISGVLILSTNQPSKFTVNYNDLCVEVEGTPAQQAINQPMSLERIEKQIRKTGNTVFEFDNLDIQLHGDLFVPMQDLNELRRCVLQKLEEKIVQSYRRNSMEQLACERIYKDKVDISPLYVYVENLGQFDEAIQTDYVARIYLDCNAISHIWENPQINALIEQAHNKKKEIYLGMPHVFRKNTIKKYKEHFSHVFEAKWDGILIRNYESMQFLQEFHYSKNIVTDYNLYQFNKSAKEFWLSQGVESTTAPLELNYKELMQVGVEDSELIIYGHYPMMVSAQCIKKTTDLCKMETGIMTLKDRYKKEFRVKNQCDYCYNMIYNTAPVVLTDQKQEIVNLNPKAYRMHFTIEDRKSMRDMLKLYYKVFYENMKVSEPNIEFTRGHFKRGIK